MARTFCLLVLCIPLFGEEFIFWAKYSTLNQTIKTYQIAISRAMVISDVKKNYVCDLDDTKQPQEDTLSYLKRNQNAIVECFSSSEVLLTDLSKFYGNSAKVRTDVIVIPTKFSIDFKKNGAVVNRLINL